MLRSIIRLRPRCVLASLFSTGLSLLNPVQAADFIPPGAVWHYFKGKEEPSPNDVPAWRSVDFDDSSWATGPVPVFYGERLTGTEIADMRGSYSSVYFRYTFDVSNPADVQALQLRVLSDDGFVAWINGQLVTVFNAPGGEPAYNATAFTAFNEPLSYDDYSMENPSAVLRTGKNVLCIHAFNNSLGGSSDFVLDASLSYTRDESVPVVERVLPPSGAVLRELSSVEIDFSEAVQGVEAADLLINGQPAADVAEFGPGQFVFSFSLQPAGPVQVSFRPDHGITDRAGTPHPFAGGSWSFTVDPNAPAPGIMISEFMTDNDRTLRDEQGKKSDWIEIYNAGSQTVSLAGWALTDKATNLTRWKFPAVSLDPNSFLIVFASGQDTNHLGRLHTNFKLTSDAGGYLALVNPAGEIISEFKDYPEQEEDVSYGRANGAPNVVGYFEKATPGAANSSQGAGFAPPVDFSEESKTYLGTLSVALAATNAQAVIHFTTDGSLPSEAAPVYSAPFALTNTAQIRARAFAPGLLPGPVRTETFIPITAPVAAVTSDLPILLIHDFDAGRPPAGADTPAFIQVFEPDTNGVASLTNLPTLSGRAVLAARGSSTEGYPQVSLKVEFQDEFGFDRDVPLAGLPSESDWVLYAPNNFEPILIHNPFAQTLGREIGAESVRTRFVEVYLVQRGLGPVATTSYNGVYVLEEKIKIGDHRVDMAKLQPQDQSLPDITGGYLMKIDRPDPGDGGFYAARQSINYVEPKEEEMDSAERAAQRDYLQNYMDAFGDALYGPNFRNPTNGYRAFVNTDSWINHHLINVLTFNVDALRLSAYFFKPRGGKLHFGPLWDFDRALNSTDGRDANPRVWRSTSGDRGTDFFNYPWWDRMFQDPDFFQDYIDRYQELRRVEFSTTNLWRLTDELANQVRQAQPRQQAKWGLNPRGSYQSEVNSLKVWLSNRVDFMDKQFVAPPSFATPGGNVTNGYLLALNVPAGATVFYTLNGQDPRATGTALGNDPAAGAQEYSGPILITANTRVLARARNPNHTALTGPNNPPLKSIWSGPVSATYVVNPLPIVITEIMYHPASDGPSSGFDSDDFEFIELKNTGPDTVSLLGMRLDGAIHFTFSATNAVTSLAPGERVVVVKNRTAFLSRYSGVSNIAGEYSGNLSNGGERIALFGPVQEPVFDFHYLDSWQPAADGLGRSIVLVDESTASEKLGEASSWRASAQNGGSPGQPEAPAPQLVLSAASRNGILTIQCAGTPGVSYTLQQADDLNAPAWQSIASQPASASGEVAFTPAITPGSKFYRVSSP